MRHKNLIFFSAIIFISYLMYFTWTYIEKHHPSLPYFGNGKMQPDLASAIENKITPVPAFSFTDESGKKISQDFIRDQIWIADFFFTRCTGICPIMSNNIKKLQSQFSTNNDIKFISFTCDPEHDSTEQLHSYAKMHDADLRQWHFATGKKQDLYWYARKGLNIVATDGDGGVNDFIHSQNLVLIDKQGYIRGYYNGTDEASVQQLILDIRKLL